ncbi:MAG: acyl-CoA dehydrogenase family protein, partial [Deltaproteobacteria bacterium]|nr:acyl-CoA dehydrogenase family protein [Deltaproteobacteria bacterium]
MNFALTEEQQMVKDTAARIADEDLKPQAAHFDESHEHPAEACEVLGELGFMGIAVPEEYGGAGMDYVSYVLALSEISRGDASVGVIMSVNNS